MEEVRSSILLSSTPKAQVTGLGFCCARVRWLADAVGQLGAIVEHVLIQRR